MTDLGRFPFVFDYNSKSEYCSCSYPATLPQGIASFVSHSATGIVRLSSGHFFYTETSVEVLLLLLMKLWETMPTCLFVCFFPSFSECDLFGGRLGAWQRFKSTRQIFSYRLRVTLPVSLVIRLNQEINLLCIQGWGIFRSTTCYSALFLHLDKAKSWI